MYDQTENIQPTTLVQPLYEDLPIPRYGERPVSCADRVGEWHVARRSHKQRKEYGLFLTPTTVANFMAKQITAKAILLRALDPAAGAGALCCSAIEKLATQELKPRAIELVAYEVDSELLTPLKAVLNYLSQWCIQNHGVNIAVKINSADFVLENAGALQSPKTLSTQRKSDYSDLIIANPPYFKISKNDPRAIAASTVVHGQPNIYALFMAVGAAMLHEQGEFVFIIPRSFASGPYFRLFRNIFFGMIRPTFVHLFDSRRSAFNRDAVLQENVVISGIRKHGWRSSAKDSFLTISSSVGIEDIETARRQDIPLATVLDIHSSNLVLRLPACENEQKVLHLVDSWTSSLSRQGLSISTGPVVPFRATQFVAKEGRIPISHAPLLWMNHVRAMKTDWPIERHKPEYITRSVDTEQLLRPNRNYVLIRRFSAKEEPRRLTAAPYIASDLDVPDIGLENHLNYVHRPNGELSVDEAWGLAALFNSELLDTWFRAVNGNTQVSATELRTMRLPPRAVIVALGQQIRCKHNPIKGLDELVARLVLPASERSISVG